MPFVGTSLGTGPASPSSLSIEWATQAVGVVEGDGTAAKGGGGEWYPKGPRMARNQGSQLLGVGDSAEPAARRVAVWRIAAAC